MASEINLDIVQGQDGDGVLYPVVDDDETPIDVTGWRARGQVRHTVNATKAIHQWDSELIPNHCTTGVGGVTITWTAAETAAWCGETFVYGIELTDPDGLTHRFVDGIINLDRGVVR